MTPTLVQSFADSDSTPAQYLQYLRHQYRVARRTLAQPVEQWPTGTSHEISRETMALCEEHAFDLKVTHGKFNANGQFAGF